MPTGFALALAAGLFAAPASASSLADYYRTMYTMKFCTTATEASAETEAEAPTDPEAEAPTDPEAEVPTNPEAEVPTDPEAEVVADPDGNQTEEDQAIRFPVDQEFIDIDATSEDVAPIFEQLNAEYNADPQAFCEQNAAGAQETIGQVT